MLTSFGGGCKQISQTQLWMLGDMSCELQTNSGVEVALMLQTSVTSARSSWESWRLLVERERHLVTVLLHRVGGPQQEEQRKDCCCGRDFFKTLTVWFVNI
ncbi:hypothetical protein GOODEAATRI_027797 [Goodea atripinnis]|uniref:Uncharacterized protein n=1 Tax=Goodea atripinnis TaxID=208336 RepID=A0ABV0MVQ0_9TELE